MPAAAANAHELSTPTSFLTTLGGWTGRRAAPNYLTTPEFIEPSFLDSINVMIPEKAPLDPDLITSDKERNLLLEANADVWVTFIHEGAGYKNTLLFYTFSIDENKRAPTSLAEIAPTLTVVFPNASRQGSGGTLNVGDRVHIGNFPANTGVGFAVMPNGWKSSTQSLKTNVAQLVYTDHAFNTASEHVQAVRLDDTFGERHVICFEDIMRPGGDKDFNDLVLMVTASPSSAVATTGAPTNALVGTDPVTDSILTANGSGLQLQLSAADLVTVQAGMQSEDTHRMRVRLTMSDPTFAEMYRTAASTLTYRHGGGTATRDGNVVTFEVSAIAEADVDSVIPLMLVRDNTANMEPPKGGTQEEAPLFRFEQFLVHDGHPVLTTLENDRTAATPISTPETNFSNYETSATIFGDPHIKTIHNDAYWFPNDEGHFVLFEDEAMRVVGRLRRMPLFENHWEAVIRESTFIDQLCVMERGPEWRAVLVVNCTTLRFWEDPNQTLCVVGAVHSDPNHWSNDVQALHDSYPNENVYARQIDLRSSMHRNLAIAVASIPNREDILTDIRFSGSLSAFAPANGALITNYVRQVEVELDAEVTRDL